MLPPYDCILKRILFRGVDLKPEFEYEGAEEFYCQMLKTFEGNRNPTEPKPVCGLLNLGVVLAIYEQHSAAEKIFLRVLEEIGGSLRPEDGLIIAQTLNNLAVVKCIQGNHQEAERLLRRALQGREQALDTSAGEMLPYMLVWCNNLAMILRSQNRAKEARQLQELVIKKVCEFWDIGKPIFRSYQKNLEWIQH
jgi:tetratricopeptide (TPR) repeat protein